jgi:protein-disulfide isomerase
MSRRQEMRAKRKRQEMYSRLGAIGLIVLGALAVVGFFVYSQYKPVGAINVPTTIPPAQADMNHAGDPNAPVQIVEYADYQCPYCRLFHEQTEPQIMQEYVDTGKVYYTYRSFGNWVSDGAGGGNTESQDAAAAAYCAGDQGKFWEYHDLLFANQNGENAGDFSRRRLEAFASQLGLDSTTFNSCLSGGKYASQVQQDGVDGLAAIKASPAYDPTQGYGTPTFFVNGTMIAGAASFSSFQQAIEAALATPSPTP